MLDGETYSSIRTQPRCWKVRVAERMDLLDKLARELQAKYSFADLSVFFKALNVDVSVIRSSHNSKYTYSKEILAELTDTRLEQIARELDLTTPLGSLVAPQPPRNWQETSQFRLFISHISKDKAKATRLKICLERYQISGFVAHEDIHPTLEWQTEIERGLNTMDALISIHTPGFAQSNFTQQELGFAMGRGSKIICLEMGEQPTGFASKHQSLPRRSRTAEQIAEEVEALLREDSRTQVRLEAAQPKRATNILDDDIPF